jgi:hypothetical protein
MINCGVGPIQNHSLQPATIGSAGIIHKVGSKIVPFEYRRDSFFKDKMACAESGEHAPDSGDEHTDVVRENVSNSANPKAICIAHLAGGDDKAEFAQPVVKHRKIEAAMRGETERGDDVALVFGRKIGIEAECRP